MKFCGTCTYLRSDGDKGYEGWMDQAYCEKFKDTLQFDEVDDNTIDWVKCLECQGKTREESWKQYVPEKCQTCKNWERGEASYSNADGSGGEVDWRGKCNKEWNVPVKCFYGDFLNGLKNDGIVLTLEEARKRFPNLTIDKFYEEGK
jgi:hypothetical protein